MKTALPKFEGRQVLAGSLRLTGKTRDKVGALALDEQVFLIVRGTVSQVAHSEVSIDGATVFARVHTVKADALMLLERDAGEKMLDEATMLADERFGVVNLFNQKDD
jgi:hypothetical protein